MKLYLKQFDIISNPSIYPSLTSEDNILLRINRRIEQIDNLKKLLYEELSNFDFYNLVLKVYNIDFEHQFAIKTKYLSNDNLTMHLMVRLDKILDSHLYDKEEIINIFSNGDILLESVHIDEYNEEYCLEKLNKERLLKDLINLIEFTNNELSYLNKKHSIDLIKQLC